MPGLGETTARLSRARKAQARQAGPGDPRLKDVPEFCPNPGGLRMLAYVPDGLPAHAPLVVVLHGCTQNAGAYARAAGWLTLAERHGFAVLAPEQSRRNNPNLCFNWFQPGDARRGFGELASIHAMTEHMVAAHGLDAGRVFVTGLSAGGAMTSALLAAYPETYAAGAVIAGLPFGVANNLHQGIAAMRGARILPLERMAAMVRDAAPPTARKPRLTVWHGDVDSTVASSNALVLVHQWAAFHGLAKAPDSVKAKGQWTRSTWKDASGRPMVELNMLGGLDHGAPVATGGDDPLGETAPYVLETGVSSSLEIARFWGLATGSPGLKAVANRASGGEQAVGAVTPHLASDIARVIGKALAAAGLIRR
jgi:poly(hydroxyalkanoate) depolymerase family esterase